MARLTGLLAAVLHLPLSAAAAPYWDVGSVNCSGEATFSLLDSASFRCTGNLSLSGGTITSESLIVIAADGSLSLDNLSVAAPAVELTSLAGPLSIGSGTSVNSGSFLARIGDGATPGVTIAPGATISVSNRADPRVPRPGEILPPIFDRPLAGGDLSLTPAVPEPGTDGLLLVGLLFVMKAVKARRQHLQASKQRTVLGQTTGNSLQPLTAC